MSKFVKIGMLLGVLFAPFYGQAQGLEINPNIKWKYIISHDLTFQSGNFIMYEFPAEKNFDYIFNITHNQDSMYAVIMVYDMQDGLVSKMLLPNNQLSIDLPFSVSQSGTYKVILSLTDPNGKKGDAIDSRFTLIRRPKV